MKFESIDAFTLERALKFSPTHHRFVSCEELAK